MTDTTDPFAALPDPVEAQDTVPQVKLGQAVTYISSGGSQKMALVTGTPASIKPGTALTQALPNGELGANELLLVVFSPTGNAYPRGPVPYGTLPDRRVWTLAE